MQKRPHIFIAPVDWGWGHSTRTAAIIREINSENEITIGVSEMNRHFFSEHFPELKQVLLPSYNISYSSFIPAWIKVLLQSFSIKKKIKIEHEILDKFLSENRIDKVISDCRFGCYSEKVQSVLITHQLKLQSPVFNGIANYFNQKMISSFNEVWVPDFEKKEQRLAGALSENEALKLPIKFVGPKSFLVHDKNGKKEDIDLLLLLSGPEPQRSIFEKKLVEGLRNFEGKMILIRGTNKKSKLDFGKIRTIDFISGNDLAELIVDSKKIICRSGYSSLMDLYLLNKKDMILVPTPGQTEQEYLAHYWTEKFGVKKITQNKLKGQLIDLLKTH